MTKFLKYFVFFAVIALAFTAFEASADSMLSGSGGDNVFTTVLDRMVVTFKNVRSVIFVIGGFGLVGLGFAAIFGKVRWAWLAALAAGLAIVAVAGAVVDYVTKSNANQVGAATENFGDTLY